MHKAQKSRLVGIIYWVPALALWNIYFTDVQVILAIQIQIKNEKRKQKTQRVKQPERGALRAPLLPAIFGTF